MDFSIFDGISEFVSDAYYGVTSAFDSNSTFPDQSLNYDDQGDEDYSFYTTPDSFRGDPRMFAEEGKTLSTTEFAREYYDDRSYLKQAQDFLYENLGVDEETAKLIKGFAGAAGAALKGQGGQGGQRGQASQNVGPRSPAARMLPTRPVGDPGVARSAQLAGLSPRAQAAMNAMAANGGKPVRDLSELIAGTNTPKGRTIANPSSLRGLNIRQSQYV